MIYHKIIGQGEPIVILHGLFGTADNWRSFSRQLKVQHSVIVVDLRNHGRSFWSEDFSYELMAGDLIELLDSIGLDHASILGHSMGGKVALHLAHHYPERVKKLVVVDIGSKEYGQSHNTIFDAIFSVEVDQMSNRNQADLQLAKYIDVAATRQFLLKNLSRDPKGGYKWKTNFKTLYRHYGDILSAIPVDNIQCDTLFIRGVQSSYISENDKIALLRDIPQAKFVDIDSGHWVHAERPQELLDAVTSFLG